MALDLYDLIDHGAQLLGWSTDTPEHQQRMAADLMLLAEVEQLTAEEGRAGPGLPAVTVRSGITGSDPHLTR